MNHTETITVTLDHDLGDGSLHRVSVTTSEIDLPGVMQAVRSALLAAGFAPENVNEFIRET